jgi:hypothetical protein
MRIESISVDLATGDAEERRVKEQLLTLFQKHNLQNWLFTKHIRIKLGVIAHSHPVLTFNSEDKKWGTIRTFKMKLRNSKSRPF